MNTRTKNIVHASVIAITAILVLVIARQGFAWTNPASNPPLANPAISTLAGNVGIGITPISKLQSAGTLTIGSGATAGTVGNAQITMGGSSPINNRLTFGTDGTGWKFAIGKNQAGTVTDLMVVQDNGSVSIGTANADANYKLTTSGGGVKAENNSATQSAGYFSNAGGGSALTIGTGGLTLGGVNKTAWPSSGLVGSGTTNFIAKWTSSSALGSANIYDDGTNIGIGTVNPGSSTKLQVAGRGLFTNGSHDPGDGSPAGVSISYDGTAGHIEAIQTGVSGRPLELQRYGNLGVGTSTPAYKLDVNGSINGTSLCIKGTCYSSWPAGPAGPTGAAGPQGPQGPAGDPASIDFGVVQRRVLGVCPAGQSIRTVNADGTVVCQAIASICTYNGRTYSTGAICWQSNVGCPVGSGRPYTCGSDGTWSWTSGSCVALGVGSC